jgi:hypothetical protein
VPRAIDKAKTKAASAGVAPRLIVGDITRLTELGIGDGYGLLLDKGCFHSISDDRRDDYVRGVSAVASGGATFLLFAFIRRGGTTPLGPRGLSRGEVPDRFAREWDLIGEQAGQPIASYDSAWYTLRRR